MLHLYRALNQREHFQPEREHLGYFSWNKKNVDISLKKRLKQAVCRLFVRSLRVSYRFLMGVEAIF